MLNKVQLIGHLGKDPETKGSNPGFVVFSVATGRKWKDKNTGEWREQTEWHNVTVYAEPAQKYAKNYLKKGSKVYVEGELETRSYEKDGVKLYATSVVVRPFSGQITGLDRREDSGSRSRDSRDDDRQQDFGQGSTGGGSRYDDLDDDIPF